MEQLQTIHYVTQDPIQNLKLRITLTRLSAARTKLQDARDKVSSTLLQCSSQCKLPSYECSAVDNAAGECVMTCGQLQETGSIAVLLAAGGQSTAWKHHGCWYSRHSYSWQHSNLNHKTQALDRGQNILMAGESVQQSRIGGSSGVSCLEQIPSPLDKQAMERAVCCFGDAVGKSRVGWFIVSPLLHQVPPRHVLCAGCIAGTSAGQSTAGSALCLTKAYCTFWLSIPHWDRPAAGETGSARSRAVTSVCSNAAR